MLGSHLCNACMARLQVDDGHVECPVYLGVKHLREGLSDRACMNGSLMPRAAKLARLAEVEALLLDSDPHMAWRLLHLAPDTTG